MPPEFHLFAKGPRPVAPFSHAVEADGWVILTGQMPTDPAAPDAPLPEGIEAQTRRGKARRAYARTILRAYRSFAREAPTRGLTAAVLQRVRDAGLPTMNADQMYNYATSNKFPELP